MTHLKIAETLGIAPVTVVRDMSAMFAERKRQLLEGRDAIAVTAFHHLQEALKESWKNYHRSGSPNEKNGALNNISKFLDKMFMLSGIVKEHNINFIEQQNNLIQQKIINVRWEGDDEPGHRNQIQAIPTAAEVPRESGEVPAVAGGNPRRKND